MSEISLKEHPKLQSFFTSLERVQSGICSIQLSDDTSPWIICPRRLLYMGNKASDETLKGSTQQRLFSKCNFPENSKIGVWTETKIKYTGENAKETNVSFDYTFDYVLCQLGRVSLKSASCMTRLEEKELRRKLVSLGYTVAFVNGEIMVEDFPVGSPFIIEVMTSSTSGGNKRTRSCIPQAFEDCLLGNKHMAPGINYRQVWARMVSQMIVKSQVAIAWGGSTIWVLQDVLAEYISASTALDLRQFIADGLSEVNILSFSYSDKFKSPKKGKVIELADATLFAGPIRPYADRVSTAPSFQDIILTPVCPPKSVLLSALCKKPISNIVCL